MRISAKSPSEELKLCWVFGCFTVKFDGCTPAQADNRHQFRLHLVNQRARRASQDKYGKWYTYLFWQLAKRYNSCLNWWPVTFIDILIWGRSEVVIARPTTVAWQRSRSSRTSILHARSTRRPYKAASWCWFRANFTTSELKIITNKKQLNTKIVKANATFPRFMLPRFHWLTVC